MAPPPDNMSAVPHYHNFSVDVSVPHVTALGEFIGGTVGVRELREESHDVMLVLAGCDWDLDAGRPGSAAYDALSRAMVRRGCCQSLSSLDHSG